MKNPRSRKLYPVFIAILLASAIQFGCSSGSSSVPEQTTPTEQEQTTPTEQEPVTESREEAEVSEQVEESEESEESEERRAVSLSAGGTHSCAIDETGAIECWGDNQHGQLDAPEGGFVQVSASTVMRLDESEQFGHSCALRDDGAVLCWGQNEDGQAEAPEGSFEQIATGVDFSCGIDSEKEIICWGNTQQWDYSPPEGAFVALSIGGNLSCALDQEGDVHCWGSEWPHGCWMREESEESFEEGPHLLFFNTQEDPLEALAVYGSEWDRRECGLDADGRLLCETNLGVCDPQGFTDEDLYRGRPDVPLRALSVSGSQHCALSAESGELFCWHSKRHPGGHWREISVGTRHSCGIDPDGKVLCWGDNSYGQALPPRGRWLELTVDDLPSRPWKQLSLGERHGCGLDAEGQVHCWGDGHQGQTSAPAGRFRQVAASVQNSEEYLAFYGGTHGDTNDGAYSCGLLEDGEVECWGDNTWGQLDAPAEKFTQISVGMALSCSVTTEGDARCWGLSSDEELDTPEGSYLQVEVGGVHACGLRDSGEVHCWEWPEVRLPYSTRYQVAGWERSVASEKAAWETPPGSFESIAAGAQFGCGLRRDGQLECWGSPAEPVRDVEELEEDSFAVCGSGRITEGIKCWGFDMPEGRFEQIDASVFHICGLRADGNAECWGRGEDYQFDIPEGPFVEVRAGATRSCGLRESGEVLCW